MHLPLQIIYPEHNAKIFLPKGFDGKTQAMVMEAAVRNPEKKVYWNLDEDYLGMTVGSHKISTVPSAGKHVLLITDEDGNTYRRLFEIIDK